MTKRHVLLELTTQKMKILADVSNLSTVKLFGHLLLKDSTVMFLRSHAKTVTD